MEHNSACKCYMVGSSTLEKLTFKHSALFVKNAFSIPYQSLTNLRPKKKKKNPRPFSCITLYHFHVSSNLLIAHFMFFHPQFWVF